MTHDNQNSARGLTLYGMKTGFVLNPNKDYYDAAEVDALLASRADAPPRGEAVAWESRWFDANRGTWCNWERIEADRELTVEEKVADFRAYIAAGKKYEIRALYASPPPALSEGLTEAVGPVVKSLEKIGKMASDQVNKKADRKKDGDCFVEIESHAYAALDRLRRLSPTAPLEGEKA